MQQLRPALIIRPLLALLVCTSLAGNAQSGRSLLWRITSPELAEPSYLLGTYHLLTDSFFNSLAEAREPFARARGIVVETVIDSSRLTSLAGHLIMPDRKISDVLSASEFTLVADELFQTTGMTLAQLNQMKPMTVAVLITLAYAQRGNSGTLARYPGTPLDYHVAAAGKRSGKNVTQLESMEEQFAMLYTTVSVEDQARQLVALVKQKELAAAAQVKLLKLYLAYDISGLYAYAEQMPDDVGNADFLLRARNEKWMTVLPALMRRESQFIAVGALHLPGPHGLIARLLAAGFRVTPLEP